MAKKYMGFEGVLYWGTAGSTADTELAIARDVSYGLDPEFADISDRSSLFALYDVAQVDFEIQFEINNKESDAFIAALRAAVTGGTAIALKTEDTASGYGVDADFVFGVNNTENLTDAQRLTVTAKPTDKHDRTPSWS